MDAPLVSVCMTAYNQEPYIAAAIEGVLMQCTNFPVELVLGEDCSTDGTLAVCQRYAQRDPDRIRLLTGAENIGWRANYRRTIAACRGRYVAFCDGDDCWTDSGKLQMQVDRMENDSTVGMCYTRTEKYTGNTGSCTYLPAGEAAADFRSLLLNYTIGNCSTLARRDLLERYYEEVRPDLHPEWLTDDVPMWLWTAARSRIAFIDRVTARHRVLARSVSHDPDYLRRIAFCDSVSGIGLWFDERYGGRRCRRKLLRRQNTTALWVLSRNGSAKAYAARWWKDVCEHPCLLANAAAYGLFLKKILLRKPEKR